MPVWFQCQSFVEIPTEAPGPFGFSRRRDASAGAAIPPPALAPASPGAAPALHHDYRQIHNLCYALRC